MDDTFNVSFVDWTPDEFIAEQCDIDRDRARRVCRLFEDGCEVAFVARYRTAQTGNLDCAVVRKAFDAFKQAKDLEKKVVKAVDSLKGKIEGKELENAIKTLKQAREPADILDVTQQFAVKKKTTKAGKARELGLESAAQQIFDGHVVDLKKYIDKKELSSIGDVEKHIVFLLADLINKRPETLEVVKKIARMESSAFLSVEASLSNKAKKLTEKDKDFGLISHFSDYTNFHRDARRMENYQVLALCRAEEKEIISWKIEVKHADRIHPLREHRVASPHTDLFKSAFGDSLERLFVPKVQRAVRRYLCLRAENAAIECFSRNLRQLFAQAPLNGTHVAALDPGYKACKAAFLSPTGEVIDTKEFGFPGCKFERNGVETLKKWAEKAGRRVVVAIGNGTASQETQKALAFLIRTNTFGNVDVKFCVVPENGASKYSVTPLAEQELPNMAPTQRSAVSIGRRLIDPMAEFVKIEPQHLGLGMYQHSVSSKRLCEALDESVREAVSLRGVDLNSASLQLLQHVCGLNKKTAAGIVALRSKGPILSRDEIKKVKGLGDKAFEQCAGFLLVNGATSASACSSSSSTGCSPFKKRRRFDAEPLDSTIVHPSQYLVAKKLLKRLNIAPERITEESAKKILAQAQCGSEEESIVRDLLIAKDDLVPPPPLLTEMRSVASLRVGELLWGRVLNQADFGLFIDIGAESNGLAHKSVLPTPPPPVGSTVRVSVISVESQRNRIGLRIVE